MIHKTFAALLCALLITAFAAAEEIDLIDATMPEAVADLLREEGFRAKLSKEEDGTTAIESAANGKSFWITFQACDEHKADCEIIILSAGFDFLDPQPESVIGNWSRDKFTKAYLDDEGDPHLEFTINSKHGITKDNLRDTLVWFTDEMPRFMKHIGWYDRAQNSQPT